MSKNNKPKSIYCELCGVRPREINCSFCAAEICRSCSETEHKCVESDHDITKIYNEGRQQLTAPAQSSVIDLPPVTIDGQLVAKMAELQKKEEELIINHYKDQADKLKAKHGELEAQNAELNRKLQELEITYTVEIKNISESITKDAQEQLDVLQKQAQDVISQYQAKVKELEDQNAKLQSEMAESLKKKINSPRQPAVEPKANQPVATPSVPITTPSAPTPITPVPKPVPAPVAKPGWK